MFPHLFTVENDAKITTNRTKTKKKTKNKYKKERNKTEYRDLLGFPT